MRNALSMLAVASLSLAGCYQYRVAGPADTVAPESGSRVAVRLTAQGALDLASQLGNQVAVVEGNVLGVDADGLQLAVTETEDVRRITAGWKGEKVTVPRQYIASVQERRFSAGATGLVGAIVVGSMAGAYALFGGSSEVTGPVGGPRPGNQ